MYRHLAQDEVAVVDYLRKVYKIDIRRLVSVVLQLYDDCLSTVYIRRTRLPRTIQEAVGLVLMCLCLGRPCSSRNILSKAYTAVN